MDADNYRIVREKTDAIMALFAEHDEQYRELVEAAISFLTDDSSDLHESHDALMKAVQPFLPRKPRITVGYPVGHPGIGEPWDAIELTPEVRAAIEKAEIEI